MNIFMQLLKGSTALQELYKEFGDAAPIIAFAKGLVGPEVLSVSGQLTPQAARRFISLLFEDPFLKEVTTQRMGKLKSEVSVVGIASRSLRRVAQGSEPADGDKADVEQFGCTLHAEDAQLFVDIKRDTIRDNADNPGYVTQLEGELLGKYRAELLDLAINGQAADFAGTDAAFLKLNKGWVRLALDALAGAEAHGGDIDIATDGWRVTLDALLQEVPAKFLAQCAIVMNSSDQLLYASEMANTDASINTASDRAMKYLQFPIRPLAFLPRNHLLITPLKNLVVGINQDIERSRKYHERKRAVEFTIDSAMDFEIAVKDAVVIGKPAAVV